MSWDRDYRVGRSLPGSPGVDANQSGVSAMLFEYTMASERPFSRGAERFAGCLCVAARQGLHPG